VNLKKRVSAGEGTKPELTKPSSFPKSTQRHIHFVQISSLENFPQLGPRTLFRFSFINRHCFSYISQINFVVL